MQCSLERRAPGSKKTLGRRSPRRVRYRRNTEESPDLTLQERHLENFFMHNRPVSEESVFSEQFAMIGCDCDVGVRWYPIEKLFDHRHQITYCLVLTPPKFGEFPPVEGWRAPPEFSAHDVLVEMLEDAMHGRCPGPLSCRLARQRVRIVRLSG